MRLPTGRVLVAAAIVGVAALVWWQGRPRRAPAPPSRPTAARRFPPPAQPSAPPQNDTPTAQVDEERHRSIVVPWDEAGTRTPTPIEEEPTARPGPTPTPDLSQCVVGEYAASMLDGSVGQVMVDITATNRCGRDLAPLDVWFWVAGYREGELVQAVRGHPFDPLPQGGQARIHVVLPGSLDWYDRIEVRPLRPDEL